MFLTSAQEVEQRASLVPIPHSPDIKYRMAGSASTSNHTTPSLLLINQLTFQNPTLLIFDGELLWLDEVKCKVMKNMQVTISLHQLP